MEEGCKAVMAACSSQAPESSLLLATPMARTSCVIFYKHNTQKNQAEYTKVQYTSQWIRFYAAATLARAFGAICSHRCIALCELRLLCSVG